MRRAALLIPGVATVLGCAGGVREIHDQPPSRPPVPITASFGKTWDVVVAQFSDRFTNITTSKRSSGLLIAETSIATRSRRVGGTGPFVFVPNNFADCGPDQQGHRDPLGAVYTVRVKGDSVTSTLVVSVEWYRDRQQRMEDMTMSEVPVNRGTSCPTSGVGEREFEMTIKRKAEGRVR